MGFLRVMICLVIFCPVVGAAPHKVVYRNKDFGIFLPVPSEARLCPTAGNGVDHGPVLLLGSESEGACRSYSRQKREITIFGESNAVEESKTLPTFLKSQCDFTALDWKEPSAKCNPAPEGLSVTDLHSEAARIDHSNGMIEFIVVTQAGKPDQSFDATVASYNYDLSLHTNTEHIAEDLAVFRAVLKAVRLNPPPPVSMNHH